MITVRKKGANMKILLPLFLMLSVCTHAVAQNTGAHDGATNPNPEKIETYIPRFGRLKPVIAVVTDAVGTELSDAIVPFGILSASNLADVHLVIKTPGIVNFTALKAQVDTSFDMFDKQFPDGADYIIIPAILSKTDPALINWLRAQGSKGSSLVSICDGSFVLAETGLMNGHRATGHWGSEQRRIQKYSQVKWEKIFVSLPTVK